ncbi:helix-turn-helix domain-containing protein [Flammeovirga sp. SubArs3]|uniref:helix-turn-helix domain-containing protein n=1 Tax=Flammeovirga sp. SubArs3 TaxID=2995316 RepID=UPI00248AF0BA|nr:helix-turn-helix domain-containing protein [Flammeovirga sp. SubArs3]
MFNESLNNALQKWAELLGGAVNNNIVTINNDKAIGTIEGFTISEDMDLLRYDFTILKPVHLKASGKEPFQDYEVPIYFGEPLSKSIKVMSNEDGTLTKMNTTSIGGFSSNAFTHLDCSNENNINKHMKLISVRVKNNAFEKYVNSTENIKKLFDTSKHFFVYEELDLSMRNIFNNLMDVDISTPFAKEHIEIYAKHLLATFFLRIEERKNIEASNTYNFHVEPVFKAKQILNDVKNENLNIDYLARECGLSGSRLRVLFKETFGITIHKYHHDIRLDESKKLLIEGQKSIMMIAMDLGFASASHFTTSFKKRYNTTPKDFQKSIFGNKIYA